jgi:hypothetical protein
MIGIDRSPREYLLDSSEPNSFVFGRYANDARLVLTRGLIKLLERDELKAVIIHELSHIKNRDMAFMTWGTTFVKSLKYWSIAFIGISLFFEAWIGLVGSEELLSNLFTRSLNVFLIFIVPSMLIVYSVSRIREFLADARTTLSIDISSLSSALLKISRSIILDSAVKKIYGITAHLMFVNVTPSKRIPHFISKYTLATHPSLIERLDALKSRGYVVTDKRLYLPTMETSVYAGLISFYFFISLTFSYATVLELVGMTFKDNILLVVPMIFVPLSIVVYLNNYMIKYSDLKILDSSSLKKQISYFLNILGRNLTSCLTLFVLGLLMGINMENIAYLFILYFLFSLILSMLYLLAKDLWKPR